MLTVNDRQLEVSLLSAIASFAVTLLSVTGFNCSELIVGVVSWNVKPP